MLQEVIGVRAIISALW